MCPFSDKKTAIWEKGKIIKQKKIKINDYFFLIK